MELYWYIIVIIFIIVKIFFYICWYRSRQRQLDAYLSNPRNAQIVIVGGRAYLHQLCEQQNSPMWYSWYGGQDDGSIGEPSGSLPPAPSYSQLEVPPPYEAVPRGQTDDLKPPPYTEHATGSIEEARALSIPEGYDACSLSDAPPPYTPSPTVEIAQQNTVMPSGAQELDSPSTAGSPCQV